MVRRAGFEVVRITGSVMSMSGCWRSRNACLSVQWMVSSLTGDLNPILETLRFTVSVYGYG